jgi:RNA polymerase sigma-70 factor (ECF subfamily)
MDQDHDYQFLLKKLDELIHRMPDKQKQVFIKKKMEGKSLRQISKEMDISVKTVEYHITAGMKHLKSEFKKLRLKGLIFVFLFLENKF